MNRARLASLGKAAEIWHQLLFYWFLTEPCISQVRFRNFSRLHASFKVEVWHPVTPCWVCLPIKLHPILSPFELVFKIAAEEHCLSQLRRGSRQRPEDWQHIAADVWYLLQNYIWSVLELFNKPCVFVHVLFPVISRLRDPETDRCPAEGGHRAKWDPGLWFQIRVRGWNSRATMPKPQLTKTPSDWDRCLLH